MRKLLLLLAAPLMMLFAMGCEETTTTPEGSMTFDFSNESVSSTSVEVTITPSNLEKRYYVGVVKTWDIATLTDSQIINRAAAGNLDVTVRTGVHVLAKSALSPNTEYTVIAYAEDATDSISRFECKTEAGTGKLDHESFEVAIEVEDIKAYSATVKATPNGSENRYFFRVITKIELDAFGIYNNDLEIFKYILENPNNNDYIYTGNMTLTPSLAAETDYLAVAFNVETFQQVFDGELEVKLFREAFTTPEGEPVDPNSLFTTSNLQTTTKGFTLDVTPVKGEESFWTYYIWTKKSYDETLANEAKVNIVMRSYFGLNNLGVEQGYDFGTFIQEYMGQTGTSQILNYEPLKNNTEYVAVLFYMDPNVKDPTEVYDYNYVAVEFKTDSPAAGNEASLEVSEPVIVADGMKYTINFVVKTNENAVDLKVGAQLYANYDFAKYWDENDWSQIQAFFLFRTSVSAETLAAAKSAEGATVSFTDFDKDEYAFFFEVINADNTPTQYGVHVTPDMF